MALSDFLFHHREEILETCRAGLRVDFNEAAELNRDVELFFDEITSALRRHDGSTSAHSPLPGASDAAARLGKQPQRAGVQPAKVPHIFGVLAHAIGAIGERHGLSLGAEEYQVFNACLDCGVATSIEHFWLGESEQRQRHIEERFSFLTHELRSAIGNAALAFKLLRAGNLELHGHTASVLANNLGRMDALISRTLGKARLSSGVPLDLRPVRVATTLRQLQASAVPERAISITLEVDESLHIDADEMLLWSAIGNLLNNAVKFSCSGGHVTLSCRADDGIVMIEVEDECGGLAETSPLFKLAQSLAAPGDAPPGEAVGVGVGLGISQRAIEAMDGQFYVKNVARHGCICGMAFAAARPTRSSSQPPAR